MHTFLSKGSLIYTLKVFLLPITISILGLGVKLFIYKFLYDLLGLSKQMSGIGREGFLNDVNLVLFLVIGVVIAPTCEEIIFRNPLKQPQIKNIALSISVYFFFTSISNRAFLLNPSFDTFNVVNVFIGMFFLLSSLFLKKNFVLPVSFKKYIIALSVILFGFAHTLPEFFGLESVRWGDLLYLFADTSPFLIIALYYSYLRLHFSLGTAILAHLFINLLGFLNKLL